MNDSTLPLSSPDDREARIFGRALELPAADCASFLQDACQGDEALRSRVEALLAADAQPDTMLRSADGTERPAGRIEFTREPVEERVGQHLGRFKLLEKIGEGGCGVVYVAEQTEPVRRRVALKVIKLGMDTKQVVARFEAERQALAIMDHPNIAKVLDAGTTDHGRPFFVMELVRGIPITDYCDQAGLSPRDRLELFTKVCHAVQHAHQKGIIHRDIKPSNILVTLHDGVPVPKVIDFGIAKATEGRLTDATIYTQLHQFVGTPAYMSPEQAEMSGLDIDTRSDIYSLGVLLYELLTGRTPFDGRELMSMGLDAMRRAIREQEPARPSTKLATLPGEDLTTTAKRRSSESAQLLSLLKGDLDWIVMKCLEKDRQRRYDTANGLAADIKRHLTSEPVVARPPSRLYRLRKMLCRNKTVSLAVAGIVTALAIGIGLAMAALVREQHANHRLLDAKQRELDQSVRADTVTAFINSLLSDTLPEMIRLGNSKGAMELIDTADRLAASSLANAPAVEIELRTRLLKFLASDFSDFQAAVRQAELISGLLSRVSDDQLKRPRELLRIRISQTRLRATNGRSPAKENAMRELDALYTEFMERSPPAKSWAALCLEKQGVWLKEFHQLEPAGEKLASAYDLLAGNAPAIEDQRYSLPAYYAAALADRGEVARAEAVVRENLDLRPGANDDVRAAYLLLVEAMGDILCRQGRFEESLRMLQEQRRVLASRDGSEADLLQLHALRGETLARSGNAEDALKAFLAAVSHPLADSEMWNRAAVLAAVTGDLATHRELCRIAVLRFASSAQGKAASRITAGMLHAPTDEMTLTLIRGLEDRLEKAQDWSLELASLRRTLLSIRENRFAEGLALLDKFRSEIQGRLSADHPGPQALHGMIRSLLCAELGLVDEAQRDFVRAHANLKLALGQKPGGDRGDKWLASYAAETWQRAAIAAFKAKSIPLPEEDTK